MARYTINYLDGNTEALEADGVEYDTEARDYTFIKNKQAVALAPVANVRSVHRQDDEQITVKLGDREVSGIAAEIARQNPHGRA